METAEPEIWSVEELLNSISDEKLLHILWEAERETLQIVVLKMMGYAPKEIAVCVGRPDARRGIWVGLSVCFSSLRAMNQT